MDDYIVSLFADKRRPATRDADGHRCTGNGNSEGQCGIRLSHDRWGLNVKLAEARWAQQQARERELEEVVDFLN